VTRTAFDDLSHEVGYSIRTIRENRRLSQEDVAHDAGLSVRHYYQIETGESNPTLRTLHRIADVFGVRLHDLLCDSRVRHLGRKRG